MGCTVSAPAVSSPWELTPELKRSYRKCFESAALLHGDEARKLLELSELPTHELKKIWGLSDVDKDGKLAFKEFVCSVHLASGRKLGLEMPQELPPELKSFVEAEALNEATQASWNSVTRLTSERLGAYRSLFERTAQLPGAQAGPVLEQLGLPTDEFQKIWELSDMDKDGNLVYKEFVCFLHLAHGRLGGLTLPPELPPELKSWVAESDDPGPGLPRKHRRNEVYLDWVETVNVFMSSQGECLKGEVVAQCMTKLRLSGEPVCSVGFQDSDVSLCEHRFHESYVIDTRSMFGRFGPLPITFKPLDGSCELLSCSVPIKDVSIPFKMLTNLEVLGNNLLNLNVLVEAKYHQNVSGANLTIKIPCPEDAVSCKILKVSAGRAKYLPVEGKFLWNMSRVKGGSQHSCTAQVEIPSPASPEAWDKPPVTMTWDIPQMAVTGARLKFFKVTEREDYKPTKWVRYVTRAGSYAVALPGSAHSGVDALDHGFGITPVTGASGGAQGDPWDTCGDFNTQSSQGEDQAFKEFAQTAGMLFSAQPLELEWLREIWISADRDTERALNHILSNPLPDESVRAI